MPLSVNGLDFKRSATVVFLSTLETVAGAVRGAIGSLIKPKRRRQPTAERLLNISRLRGSAGFAATAATAGNSNKMPA